MFGRGRSAAVVGSVANALLRSPFGPIVLVGPSVARAADVFRGDIVVALDGSARDAACPILLVGPPQLAAPPRASTDVSAATAPGILARR